MRPIAPLELWLLAHRPTNAQALGIANAPLPLTGAYRSPLTKAELWDKLIAESGMERIQVGARAA